MTTASPTSRSCPPCDAWTRPGHAPYPTEVRRCTAAQCTEGRCTRQVPRPRWQSCLGADFGRYGASLAGVQYLAAAPSLETLVLPGGPSMSSGITDAALEALSRAQSLKHLSVLVSGWLSVASASAGQCHLHVPNAWPRPFLQASRATDEGLAHLARCKHLESLGEHSGLASHAPARRVHA